MNTTVLAANERFIIEGTSQGVKKIWFNGKAYDPTDGHCVSDTDTKRMQTSVFTEYKTTLEQKANAKCAALFLDEANNQARISNEIEKAKNAAKSDAYNTGYLEGKAQRPRLGDSFEEAIVSVMAEHSASAMFDEVKPKLDDYIKNTYGMIPVSHEIHVADKPSTLIKGIVHEQLDTVVSFVGSKIPVYLAGPAGSGKNVIAKQVSQALGLDFYFTNAVTDEYKLTGFIDANGHYQARQFYDAFTKGGLFFLDEMDASVPEVLVILNAAIANGYFDFPCGHKEAHPDFRVVAAGNTFGTGADNFYTGRYQLDAASLDRFAVIDVDYSENIEKGIAEDDLISFIHRFRDSAVKNHLKTVASYRCLSQISAMIDTGMDVDKVLRSCLIKALSKDETRALFKNMSSGSTKYDKALERMTA